MLAHPRQIAEAFNARAATYRDSDWHRTSAERLIELSGVRPGDRVLDAGTGTGFAGLAAARLVGPAGAVVGVDLSPGMLAVARESAAQSGLTNFDAVEADATTLPQFADGSFDAVTSATSLLYMPAAAALREWARVLRPGGLLAFSMPSPLLDLVFDMKAETVGERLLNDYWELGRIEDEATVDFQLRYGDWIRLFRASGLELIDLIELRAPEDADTTYELAPHKWARRWPAENIWKARKRSGE